MTWSMLTCLQLARIQIYSDNPHRRQKWFEAVSHVNTEQFETIIKNQVKLNRLIQVKCG